MKIAILGYATEGKVSYEYFKNLSHDVVIHDGDENITVPEGANNVLGDQWLDDLGSYDLVVRTAGLNPNKILEKNPGLKPKITSATNEFLKKCPTKNVIGVTGTKGKGTTSTLIARMLEKSGKKVYFRWKYWQIATRVY